MGGKIEQVLRRPRGVRGAECHSGRGGQKVVFLCDTFAPTISAPVAESILGARTQDV